MMMHTRRITIGACLVLAFLACAPSAHAQAAAADTRDRNLRAYAELLRSDLRAQKVAVITEVMEFTEAEDTAFWPVYREYETELAKINDDRMALIKDYATGYDTLTDATADGFAVRALGLEARRHALLERFYARFKAVVPAKTAARFLQVEHQILLLMDLQIAASLPIAER
jgi:hypothetical protein